MSNSCALEADVHFGSIYPQNQVNTVSKFEEFVIQTLLCNVQMYLGKNDNAPREVNQGTRVVLDMTKEIKKSGRNVTCDNFFTSLRLVQQLLEKKRTIMGTLRKNKLKLPFQFTVAKTVLLPKFFCLVRLCAYSKPNIREEVREKLKWHPGVRILGSTEVENKLMKSSENDESHACW